MEQLDSLSRYDQKQDLKFRKLDLRFQNRILNSKDWILNSKAGFSIPKVGS